MIAGLVIHLSGIAILLISFDKQVADRSQAGSETTFDCGSPAGVLLRSDAKTPVECKEEASQRARTAGALIAVAFIVGAGGLLLTRLRLRRQFR